MIELHKIEEIKRVIYAYDSHQERIKHGEELKKDDYKEVGFYLNKSDYKTFITYEKRV